MRGGLAWILLGLAACGASSGNDAPVVTPPANDAGPPTDPSGACPAPGFRGALDAACVNGGWATCPEGSVARASGWGCEAVLPTKACTGATRDVLGSPTCAPVGDCAAAFPPPEATLFVDPKGASDATHFTTIGAALAAAPAGAVIAVEAGSYPESLVASKDVTIAGRCAAQVMIVGSSARVRGLRVEGAHVVARGMTITKQFIGVSVGSNGDLTMTDSVVDDNEAQGIVVSEGAAKVTLERVVVRDTRESASTGDAGQGLNLQAGSVATVKDCAFSGNRYANVRVSTSSIATLDHVVLRDGRPNRTQDVGRALSVQTAASVTLTHAACVDNYEVAIVAADDTKVVLEDVLVGRTKLAAAGEFGRALDLFGGADVRATRFHAYDNHDASVIAVEAKTHLVISASSIVDTAFDKGGYVGRSLTVRRPAGSVVFPRCPSSTPPSCSPRATTTRRTTYKRVKRSSPPSTSS